MYCCTLLIIITARIKQHKKNTPGKQKANSKLYVMKPVDFGVCDKGLTCSLAKVPDPETTIVCTACLGIDVTLCQATDQTVNPCATHDSDRPAS